MGRGGGLGGCSAPLWQGPRAGGGADPRTTCAHSLAREGMLGWWPAKAPCHCPQRNHSMLAFPGNKKPHAAALPCGHGPGAGCSLVTLMASAADGRSWALRLAMCRRRVLSRRGRASLWSRGMLNLAAIHRTAATQYTEAWRAENPAVLSRPAGTPDGAEHVPAGLKHLRANRHDQGLGRTCHLSSPHEGEGSNSGG